MILKTVFFSDYVRNCVVETLALCKHFRQNGGYLSVSDRSVTDGSVFDG